MIPIRDDNPSTRRPLVTMALLGACALVFLWQVSLDSQGMQEAVFLFGVVPALLFGSAALPPGTELVPPTLTVLTSMFLHGGWMHLLGNMLFLWIFGDNVEDAMGHRRFLLFYVLCGIAAALAQALPEPDSTVPMIGASGAISGVLGAYLLLYPHARVLVAAPIVIMLYFVRLPALVVLGFWFAIQLGSELLSEPGTAGVAFRAHIGGFVAGMVLVTFFKRRGVALGGDGRD